MARLIDADALMKYIRNHDYQLVSRMGCVDKGMFTDGIEHGINIQPTVDAVEVVRCKDCKHGVWDEENEMWKCVESADYDEDAGEWFGFYEYHNGDFFCADGERKDNDSF